MRDWVLSDWGWVGEGLSGIRYRLTDPQQGGKIAQKWKLKDSYRGRIRGGSGKLAVRSFRRRRLYDSFVGREGPSVPYFKDHS